MRTTTLSLILVVLLVSFPPPLLAAGPSEINRLTEAVEMLRGLRFLRPVEHRRLTRADLRPFLEKQIETELPVSVDTYMATLTALYLVDPSATVDSMLDLYDAQVLAFYDPVGHVYYSLDEPPADIDLPPAMTEAVVVHELVHALQDQRFEAGDRTLAAQANWDAALAYQAVLEGEALLVMMGYLGSSMGMSLDDLVGQESFVEAVRESAAAGMNVPQDVPAYFVESLRFPYVEGLAFVVDTYLGGGWNAVDAIHRTPPRSTEELLDPGLWAKRVAAGVESDDAVRSKASDRLVETTLGEFHWSFLLGAEAGRGWASDVVSVRHGDGGATVLVESTWDDEREAEEFEQSCRAFLEEKNAPNRTVLRTGARVKAAWGADAKTAGLFAGSGEQDASQHPTSSP